MLFEQSQTCFRFTKCFVQTSFCVHGFGAECFVANPYRAQAKARKPIEEDVDDELLEME